MKFIKTLGLTLASASLCFSVQSVAQQPATSLDDLLDQVESSRIGQTAEYLEREERFRNNTAERQNMLDDMNERRATEERISATLENTYNENEIIKADKYNTLQDRLGDLDELFGTIAGVVGDTRSNFESSLISAEFDGRGAFLTDLADVLSQDSVLPSIDELERLWFLLQQEMTESGRIVTFNASVAQPDGTQATEEVIRIGSFNIVANGQYLTFDGTTNRLSVLPKQPSANYVSAAAELQASSAGFVSVAIDPTGPSGGSYLRTMVNVPNRGEQIEQGGTMGRVILGVGAFGLLFALERMFSLTLIGIKVKSQLRNTDKISKKNPLGRVLSVYESDKNLDIETLELKLGEAILKELPGLERFLGLLKIIATVAPLMGLLGTVMGMIQVFQAITLFGTGDPQIMAGGISGALVTTVLGLVVAIPFVLMHTVLKSRSDNIIHVLEEQATGIIARKSEANGATNV